MLNNKRLKKGIFITFEGIDGSGKSTQIKKLARFFKENNYNNVFFTKEPGGTDLGDNVRKLLLKNQKIQSSPETQILLHVASRFEHFKKLILPSIKKKKIVISDRYEDSTVAYQCGNNKKLNSLLKYLNSHLFKKLEPDLTILLDIKPHLAIERLKKRKSNNLFDNKTISFYSSVRNNYIKISKQKKRINVITSSIPEEELFKKIKKLIFQEIEKKCF